MFCLKVICDWPSVTLKISIRGKWSDSPMEKNKLVNQPPHKDKWMEVHANQDYTIIVEMTRQGGRTNSVHCPRFPRGKDESWFLTLGSMEYKEVLALKRASIRGSKSTQQINFFTPFNRGIFNFEIYLQCKLVYAYYKINTSNNIKYFTKCRKDNNNFVFGMRLLHRI